MVDEQAAKSEPKLLRPAHRGIILNKHHEGDGESAGIASITRSAPI
jgi:hypothetical protein